jgi:hypothetical protein
VTETTTARRRGHGEDAIYFDATKNRYAGAVSLGFGPDGKRNRRKVIGRTKQEVRDKLKALHAEPDRGLRTSSTYTVRQAVDDWLEGGLEALSDRLSTRPIEEIARLDGHNQTATTELVYRHELPPVITTGAEVMDRILSGAKR